MRCRNKLYLLLLIGILGCTQATHAQEADTTYLTDTNGTEEAAGSAAAEEPAIEAPPRLITYNKAAPTPAQWQQTTADKVFAYKTEKEFTALKQPSRAGDPWILKVLIGIFRFFASLAGRILLLALVALLVGYILYRILSGEGRIFSRKNRRIITEEEPTQISEEDLLHNDWEGKLRKALAEGDHRMSIRYSYMQLLQLLQARNLIQYRQDKTNAAYFHELSDHAVGRRFRQITREYEYAWYGNFLPSPAGFESYLQTFNGVKKELGAS